MLTDIKLRSLKPGEKAYKVADRDVMYAVVATSGTITFRLDCRLSGPLSKLNPLAKPPKPIYQSRTKGGTQWNALKANKAQRAAYVGVAARYDNRNLGVSGGVRYGQAEEDKARALAQKRADKDADQMAQLPDGTERAISPGAENAKTLRHVYTSKANALRAARAEWRRLQRGVATFSIMLAKGRLELFPEIPATVRGFKPQIDSTDWIIAKATHNLNDNGLGTVLEFDIKATVLPD